MLPKLNRVSIAAALGGIITPANEFCCDGGTAIVAFARKAGIPTHILPLSGRANPSAPDFHINNVNAYHGRLKEWRRRFHGVATKNLPNYLGWRRALEALGPNATPARWIPGAIGLGPYQQTAVLRANRFVDHFFRFSAGSPGEIKQMPRGLTAHMPICGLHHAAFHHLMQSGTLSSVDGSRPGEAHLAQSSAAGGMISHCVSGERPVPSQGSLGIHAV